jgi:thioredoxin-like negative regulator of GroEL
MSSQEEVQAAIKVVRGNPDDAELATVIAVLNAAINDAEAAKARAPKLYRSSWGKNSSMLRGNLVPGFGQWSASSRPGLD